MLLDGICKIHVHFDCRRGFVSCLLGFTLVFTLSIAFLGAIKRYIERGVGNLCLLLLMKVRFVLVFGAKPLKVTTGFT